jgi:hypothetical protein
MIRNLIFAAIFAFSAQALGSDNIQSLRVHGKAHYQGENLVRLKRLANQILQQQGESARDYELVGVTVRAKSRKGRGQATLIVGRDQQTKTVKRFDGGDLGFQISTPWSYNNIRFDLRQMPGQGDERWQMRFNGNIKVHSIILHIQAPVERVRIPMGGELFTQDSTIRIKQRLRDMGYGDLRDAQLKNVVLVAKSQAGRGQAELVVGQDFQPLLNVGLAPQGTFQDNQPLTYNRLRWNVRGSGQGRWQIHMRGRIRVRAVIVEFK